MEQPPSPADPGRGITRHDLEVVIRRAAELYTREADADDHLTEAEVLRIAEELGLPSRHVRRALYELPAPAPPETRIDRWYGRSNVQGTRVVPGAPTPVLDSLEEYLVTREFLQVVRRQGERAAFAPADDAISSVARAVRRPNRHWYVARSKRVLVEVRPMPDDASHVRLEIDLGQQRRRALRGGIAGGIALGLPIAALVGVPVGAVAFDLVGSAAGSVAAVTTALGALGGTTAAGIAVGRARFRNRVENARLEMAALLDRLERGGTLDPPSAPWIRGLRSRIRGTLRGRTADGGRGL